MQRLSQGEAELTVTERGANIGVIRAAGLMAKLIEPARHGMKGWMGNAPILPIRAADRPAYCRARHRTVPSARA